ncbi:hypothetical protein WQ54_19205 [Bacillus sp. SA1-12]|nr:hypothetical protein WQ54_19205 [Bacillus sp. SA1-12]
MTMTSINKKLRLIVEKDLQPFGITGPQFHMLLALKREGGTRVTHLADLMKVKPSAITVIMDRLIERELVQRTHSLEDRRVVMMELSPKGIELLEEVRQSHQKMMSHYFSRFSEEELSTFLQLFEKLDGVISTTNREGS